MSLCVVLCGVVSLCVVLCHFVWCCVTLCGVVWCCVTLCAVVSLCVGFIQFKKSLLTISITSMPWQLGAANFAELTSIFIPAGQFSTATEPQVEVWVSQAVLDTVPRGYTG